MNDSIHPLGLILLFALLFYAFMELIRGYLFYVATGTFNRKYKQLQEGNLDEREYYDKFLVEAWQFLKVNRSKIED